MDGTQIVKDQISDMETEDFQLLAAAILERMGKESYTMNKGIFEYVSDFELDEVQTYIGQYNSYDR
jgi:hypothetical protein